MEPVIVWVLVIEVISGAIHLPPIEIEYLTDKGCEQAKGGMRPNENAKATCEPKLQTIRRGS